MHARVQDVECHVREVGNEVHVALGTSSPALRAEGLLVRKAEEEEAQVVCQRVERRVVEACALLEVVVVSVRKVY